jgi:hypothetical protein
VEINCEQRRLSLISETSYKNDGSARNTVQPKNPVFTDIAPDSAGDVLAMMVCPKK